MNTFYIGRFTFELPEDYEKAGSRYKIFNVAIADKQMGGCSFDALFAYELQKNLSANKGMVQQGSTLAINGVTFAGLKYSDNKEEILVIGAKQVEEFIVVGSYYGAADQQEGIYTLISTVLNGYKPVHGNGFNLNHGAVYTEQSNNEQASVVLKTNSPENRLSITTSTTSSFHEENDESGGSDVVQELVSSMVKEGYEIEIISDEKINTGRVQGYQLKYQLIDGSGKTNFSYSLAISGTKSDSTRPNVLFEGESTASPDKGLEDGWHHLTNTWLPVRN